MSPTRPRVVDADRRQPTRRALAPLVGALVLLCVTVALAGTVAVLGAGLGPGGAAPTAILDLSVNATTDDLALDHRGGDDLDVETLSVRVAVDDRPLDHQPPVPFFQTTGFEGGPEGPFNAASDPEWTTGERASVRVANTNDPSIDPGDEVRVTLGHDPSDRTVATVEATAR